LALRGVEAGRIPQIPTNPMIPPKEVIYCFLDFIGGFCSCSLPFLADLTKKRRESERKIALFLDVFG
jgi:hypothetical protein